jgi:hypothetical protein
MTNTGMMAQRVFIIAIVVFIWVLLGGIFGYFAQDSQKRRFSTLLIFMLLGIFGIFLYFIFIVLAQKYFKWYHNRIEEDRYKSGKIVDCGNCAMSYWFDKFDSVKRGEFFRCKRCGMILYRP